MSNVYWLRFNSSVAPYTTSGLAPTFINFAKFDGTTLAPPGITAPFASLGIYQFTYTPSFSIAFVVDGATTGLSTANRYIAGNLDINDSLANAVETQATSITALGSTLSGVGSTLSGIGSTLTAIGTEQTNMGTTLISLSSGSVLALGTTLVAIGNTLTSVATVQLATGTSISVLALGSTLTAIGTAQTNMGTTLVAIGNTMGTIGTSFAAILTVLGGPGDSFGGITTQPTTIYGIVQRVQEDMEGTATFDKATGTWTIMSRGGSLLATRTLANTASTITKS